MDRLKNRVAFITGGASGIGLALARCCADEGMAVVIGDVESSSLEAAAEELRQLTDRVLPVQVDVTDRGALQQALTNAVDAFGAVNLLCNNAGVNAAGPVDTLTFRDWDWVLGVNLGGVVNGIVTFLPELLRHPGAAHIVNTASVGGLLGMAALAPYNASKFAVVGLSEALRTDQFFICTHGEFAPLVAERGQVLLDAFPRQASEEDIAFARGLVPDLR